MNNPAAELGRLSAAARRKKLGKRRFNASMKEIAKRPRPSRRKLDKSLSTARNPKRLASAR